MEYGRIVGESGRIAGGGRSQDRDLTGQVMDAVSDAMDQIASLPPEFLIVATVVAIVGLVFLRR